MTEASAEGAPAPLGSGGGRSSEAHPALPPPLRRPAGLVGALSAVLATLLGAWYAGQGGPSTLDGWLQPTTASWGPGRSAALLIDAVGEPTVAISIGIVLAVACLLLRRWRLAALAVVGPGSTGLATTVLKPVVDRTIRGAYECFPSGHTAAATALALVVGLLANDLARTRRRAPARIVVGGAAGAAGAAMGWAQVFLGAHYPTDTIGGFCTAVALVSAAAWLIDCLVWIVVRRSDERPA